MMPNHCSGRQSHWRSQVEGDLFELSGGGSAFPEHTVDVEGGAEHFSQDPGRGCGYGEIGEEARVIPVGEGWNDEALEVLEDDIHGFGLFGRAGGELVDEVAGLHVGEHGVIAGVGEVVGDPVDDFVAVLAELVRSHGLRRGWQKRVGRRKRLPHSHGSEAVGQRKRFGRRKSLHWLRVGLGLAAFG